MQIEASKPSESDTNQSTTTIPDAIDNTNVGTDSIENDGSTHEQNEIGAKDVNTNTTESSGEKRVQIEASKPSESDTNQSTTIVVIDIIDGIINNVINNVVEQTGDKFVRISNGYDILNDELDDISNSMIEPQQEYTGVLSNDSSTTSIDNALSLLRTLHLGKLHSKNNDTTSTTSNNNNENTSQNNHSTVETMNSPNNLEEYVDEVELEETQNSSIMTPLVAQLTLPKIIPFTNTNTNDE